MIIPPRFNEIRSDFVRVATLAGFSITLSDIEVEYCPAPHEQPKTLPPKRMAVYVFMYGDRCLKVGKAGPNSAARFCSQHYGTQAPSTLAKSLMKRPDVIGASNVDESNVKALIRDKTTRVNFLIPSQYGVFALSLLEAFIQCLLQPKFEGFASQRAGEAFVQ
jgi:hypothetical protein